MLPPKSPHNEQNAFPPGSQLADAKSHPGSNAMSSDFVPIIRCRVQAYDFGLEMAEVASVQRVARLARKRMADGSIGVLEGSDVSIHHLADLMGLAHNSVHDAAHHILVLRSAVGLWGILVEQVSRVMPISQRQIYPIPPVLIHQGYSPYKAILQYSQDHELDSLSGRRYSPSGESDRDPSASRRRSSDEFSSDSPQRGRADSGFRELDAPVRKEILSSLTRNTPEIFTDQHSSIFPSDTPQTAESAGNLPSSLRFTLLLSPNALNPRLTPPPQHLESLIRARQAVLPELGRILPTQSQGYSGHRMMIVNLDDNRTAPSERHPLIGLSISQMLEIVDYGSLLAVPRTGPDILGLITWRGVPIPVIDLGMRLGGSRRPIPPRARLVLVRTAQGELLAFPAHPSMNTVHLPVNAPPCPPPGRLNPAALLGSFLWDNQILVIPNLEFCASLSAGVPVPS